MLEKTKKYGALITFFLAAAVIFGLFHETILNANRLSFAGDGDGLKSTFGTIYHIKHDPGYWHTGAMTRRSGVLDELEPEAVASLAPGDMSRMNIEPGAMVKVSTRRGVIELRARADGAVPGGMVFIPFCYAEAPANVLTNQALDPFGKIPEFKFCAARVDAL